ncbi:MAG TPA: hypothetical protein PKX93_00120 [bacterium]|nr:hypothetical protein [bacterium]HOL65846.1 hypothetical protein [bacterium]HPP11104.1 hypothetical protein [bacterium]
MPAIKLRCQQGNNGIFRITLVEPGQKISGLERYGFLEGNWT